MEYTRDATHRDATQSSEPGSDDDSFHIDVCITCTAVEIDEKRIRDAVQATWRRLDVAGGELSVAVVDDATIADLNRRYRDEDRATDVLSFGWGDDAVDGEVIVSAETAERTAKARRVNATGELILYVVHGCLHLLDFDDLEPEDAAKMHRMENEIMTGLGYGAAYGEVSP